MIRKSMDLVDSVTYGAVIFSSLSNPLLKQEHDVNFQIDEFANRSFKVKFSGGFLRLETQHSQLLIFIITPVKWSYQITRY